MTDQQSPELRVAYTIFGPVLVSGPFADDYTTLKWEYREHRDGETARFAVAGLRAYVQDCDGDRSWWQIKDTRTKQIVAEGEDHGHTPAHFFKCLADAEAALRSEVTRRKALLRTPNAGDQSVAPPSPPSPETNLTDASR